MSNPVQEFFDQLDNAIEESSKPLLIETNSNPEKSERIMGVLNHLKDNNATTVCNIGTSDPTNMFGVFLDDGRRAMPNWSRKFVEVCNNNKDKDCLMIFDDMDKTSKEAISLFIHEVINNDHDLYPLPTNSKLVCLVDNKENISDNTIENSALSNFTIVNRDGVVSDYSDFVK